MTTETGIGRGRPRVSVVVPSYNQGRFIGEALDSILSQGYPDLEVLVMDGGSTDETLEILKGYGHRIRFESGRDGGQADALNRGFAKATGEIVGWLNSDDRYCPGAIEEGVAALETEPEAGFVYGEGELIAEDGRVISRSSSVHQFDLWRLIHVIDFIMQPAVFMRRVVLIEAGGLDVSLHYGLDWDLWIRMALRGSVVYCPSFLAQSREHAATKTSCGGFRRWRELKQIVCRHGGSIGSPSVLIYGLDTLRRKWPVVFGPRTIAAKAGLEDRILVRPFRWLHQLVRRSIEVRLRRSQGIWSDGWSTARTFVAVAWGGSDARIDVCGEVPAPPDHFPLRIQLLAGGNRSELVIPAAGKFGISLDLSGDGRGIRAMEVVIRSSRVFRAEGDPRHLAIRLTRVSLQESGRTQTVWPNR